MATEYYVDSVSGNDANSGADWANAKEHLSAGIALLTSPVTDEIIFHLKKGVAGTPYTYEEDANDKMLSIDGITCGAGGSVSVQVEDWSDSDYEEGDSPIGGASFDPKEEKLAVLEFSIKIENLTSKIAFKGLQIEEPPSPVAAGVYIEDGCRNIRLVYCEINDFYAGIYVTKSECDIENCYIHENSFGAVAQGAGTLIFIGDNYIGESAKVGILATANSHVYFKAWDEEPLDHFKTYIYTASPRADYKAVMGTVNSTIMIDSDATNLIAPKVAFLKILNLLKFDQKGYFGIVLESQSLFAGVENVTFRDDNVNEGKDTIPNSNKYKGTGGSNIV